jgi:hypothetical protein
MFRGQIEGLCSARYPLVGSLVLWFSSLVPWFGSLVLRLLHIISETSRINEAACRDSRPARTSGHEPRMQYQLLVGAYFDNEVSATHPS